MSSILPARTNKFAYPGGQAQPGFNPAHPAYGRGAWLSAFPIGANFINLITANIGTLTGTPSGIVDGSMGAVINFGASQKISLGNNPVSSSVLTMAAIAKLPVVGSSRAVVSVNTSAILYFNAGTGGALAWYDGSAVTDSTLPIPASSTPYFFAGSLGPSSITFVQKNLTTGSVQSTTIAHTTTSVGSGNPMFVGGDGFSNYFLGSVAVGAISPVFVPEIMLRQWADDPWNFWYPQTLDFADMLATGGPAAYSGSTRRRSSRTLLSSRPTILAFPGGQAGTDPSHPASTSLIFSGVTSQTGGFYNLLNGAPGANTGSMTATILGGIGPATKYPSSGTQTTSFTVGHPVKNVQAVTTAAIVQWFDIQTGGFDFITNLNVDTGGRPGLAAITALLAYRNQNGVNLISSLPLSNNIPYFVALSTDANNNINFLVRRLDTGVVTTQAFVGNNDTPSIITNVVIGDWATGGLPAGASIAAAMWSLAFMSMPQLLAWAADPWSFWYPQQPDFADMLHGPQAQIFTSAGILGMGACEF